MPALEFGGSGLFAFFEGVPCGVFVFQLEDQDRPETLRIVFANKASERIIGLEAPVVTGTLIGEHFANSLVEGGVADIYRRVVVDQQPHDLGVVDYSDVAIEHRRFGVSAYPVGPDLVAILFDDLTAGAGRTTELAAIVESADDGILSKSLDGTILTWNAGAERMYGYDASEAIGQPIAMLLPPDRAREDIEIIEQLLAGERVRHFETRRVRKDGSLLDVSLTISPIVDLRGVIVGAATIARDVEARNAAQAQIHELAAIVATSEDAIISRSPEGIVRSWNEGAERLFGYSPEEMVGASVDLLSAGEDTTARRESLIRGERQTGFEMTMRRKDGTDVHVSVASSPIRTADGAVVGAAGVIRDLTDHDLLEEQLRQSAKMEAIGNLASGVAHDFNNVITVIRGNAGLLLKGLVDEGHREKARQIDYAAEHAATLTQQLLAFSRQQVLQPAPLDVNAIVDETLDLAARLIGENIELTRELDVELAPILADRGQLQQVIINLAVNSRDAMPEGGVFLVRTRNVTLDQAYASEHLDVVPGRYVLLEIADSGIGMNAETQRRIFDPFFTTKDHGTGLGLATVYGIVRQSGGHIWLYSEPGIGTTFKIYFPPTELPVVQSSASVTAVTSLEGRETILLVDDAELLRPLVVEVLESYGYTVFAAANAPEAIAIVAENDGIDLLLTDVVMPGMHGGELADTLLRTCPDLKVLFSSGYPSHIIDRHGIAEARVAFIQKPFLAEELATKLRLVLDAA